MGWPCRNVVTDMQNLISLTGIVIKSEPAGEFDRRVVLLTKERGKITAFARQARKPGNKLMAPTNPFSFGQFKLYAGRNTYTLTDAEISNYFEQVRVDMEAAYYGMYFFEICDFYARENIEESTLLKLLYQSLRALTSPQFSNKLVRVVFELRAIVINGEFPGISDKDCYSDSTKYAIDFIVRTPVEKLYTFKVTDQVLEELGHFSAKICKKIYDKDFKSLEILENIV